MAQVKVTVTAFSSPQIILLPRGILELQVAIFFYIIIKLER